MRRPASWASAQIQLAADPVLVWRALIQRMLAGTGAIQFSVPMLIARLSAWWLHEPLTWRRRLPILVDLVVLPVVRKRWFLAVRRRAETMRTTRVIHRGDRPCL